MYLDALLDMLHQCPRILRKPVLTFLSDCLGEEAAAQVRAQQPLAAVRVVLRRAVVRAGAVPPQRRGLREARARRLRRLAGRAVLRRQERDGVIRRLRLI